MAGYQSCELFYYLLFRTTIHAVVIQVRPIKGHNYNHEIICAVCQGNRFFYDAQEFVDDTVTWYCVTDVATDVNNNTYILVQLKKPGTDRGEVQVFTKTGMCNKFPVSGPMSDCLTVGHVREFVNNWHVIDMYELKVTANVPGLVLPQNILPVCSFGEGPFLDVIDIAAGSDGQIFVLERKFTNDEKIAHVFTEDGHQQNEFRVNSKEDDYSCLASYPSGKHIVFSSFERTTRRLKVAMYGEDGVFN